MPYIKRFPYVTAYSPSVKKLERDAKQVEAGTRRWIYREERKKAMEAAKEAGEPIPPLVNRYAPVRAEGHIPIMPLQEGEDGELAPVARSPWQDDNRLVSLILKVSVMSVCTALYSQASYSLTAQFYCSVPMNSLVLRAFYFMSDAENLQVLLSSVSLRNIVP